MALADAFDMSDFPDLDTRLAKSSRTGYWEIRWTETTTTPEGLVQRRTRTYSCRTKNRREAEQVRYAWLRAGAQTEKAFASPTIGELVRGYAAGKIETEGLSATQSFSLKPIGRLLGAKQLADVENADIIAYRAARRKEGVVDGTIRRELSALRTVLNWCKRTGVLPKKTDLPDFDLPPESDPRKVFVPDWTERNLFALAASSVGPDGRLTRIGRFICLALAAPARAATIEELTWDRVDLVNGWIDYRVPGKRLTKKKQVPNPISKRLKPVLERAKREATTDYVLDHPGSTRKAWETFRKDNGLGGYTRHDLRRTWASLAVQSGVPLAETAQVLGDTVATVTKHYAHLAPDHMRRAIDARS